MSSSPHLSASLESASADKTPPALSVMPLKVLARSYLIAAISSIPLLLRPSLRLMDLIAHTKNPILSPDSNPILHFIMKKTVYAQFCAGENQAEVQKTVQDLKKMGYTGTIVAYGREAVLSENEQSESRAAVSAEKAAAQQEVREVGAWKAGNLATIEVAAPGDFIALKFTGAGKKALAHLLQGQAPSPVMASAIEQVCELAKARNVRLLFDAEQVAVQQAIDDWTIDYQRRYNKHDGTNNHDVVRGRDQGRALIYGTYQAYLRHTPTRLAEHLAAAAADNFTLGIKLVRGAYIGSDPRHYIWATQEETDRAYDTVAASVIKREYCSMLTCLEGRAFPEVDLFLATHNKASVDKACELRALQSRTNQSKIELMYGQIQGMADHISCDLIQRGKLAREKANALDAQVGHSAAADMPANMDIPKAYKYVVWGSVGECSKYLVRRAQENKDAVGRTVDSRKALGKELLRRLLFQS